MNVLTPACGDINNNADLICALYDENNGLINVKVKNITEFNHSIKSIVIPCDSNSVSKVKVMLFDSLQSAKSIAMYKEETNEVN